jgi:hypothetical protein
MDKVVATDVMLEGIRFYIVMDISPNLTFKKYSREKGKFIDASDSELARINELRQSGRQIMHEHNPYSAFGH